MDWVRNNLSKAILLAILSIIVLMAAILFQSLRAERDVRTRSLATTELVGNLQELLRVGLEAETGQRGFLLTGETQFLDPYQRASEQWLADIAAVRGDLKSAGAQSETAHITRLRRLAAAKLKDLEQTISLSRSGQHDFAVQIVKDDRGRILMDQIRNNISGIVDRRMEVLAAEAAELYQIRLIRGVSVLFLIAAMIGLSWFGFFQARNAERAAYLDREAVLLRDGKQQADLIAQELNHRVKNIFTVILSLVTLSARDGDDVPTTLGKIRKRIFALSTAHSISQGGDQQHFEISELISAIMAPYREEHRSISFSGPKLQLPSDAITPLGLILHELATNALKYGALSVPNGELKIDWQEHANADGKEIMLNWSESGGPSVSQERDTGFGSTMISAATDQLRGALRHDWRAEGLMVDLRFPIG